jgi:hypothetical protein
MSEHYCQCTAYNPDKTHGPVKKCGQPAKHQDRGPLVLRAPRGSIGDFRRPGHAVRISVRLDGRGVMKPMETTK